MHRLLLMVGERRTCGGAGPEPSQGMGRPLCCSCMACCIFVSSACIIFCSSWRNFL